MSGTPVRARFLFQGRGQTRELAKTRDLDSSAEIIDDTPEHRYRVVTVALVLIVLPMVALLPMLILVPMLTLPPAPCRPGRAWPRPGAT